MSKKVFHRLRSEFSFKLCSVSKHYYRDTCLPYTLQNWYLNLQGLQEKVKSMFQNLEIQKVFYGLLRGKKALHELREN